MKVDKPQGVAVGNGDSASDKQNSNNNNQPQIASSGNVGGAVNPQNLQGTWDCGRYGISRNNLSFENPDTFVQQEIVYSDTGSATEVRILKFYFTYKQGDPDRLGGGSTNIDFTRGKITRTLKTAEEVSSANAHIRESAACSAITYAIDQETDVTACLRAENLGQVMYSTIKLTHKNISLGNCYPNEQSCGSVDQRGDFLLDPCAKAL